MISKNTRFLIVGLGLMGGSYAMGLKKEGYYVSAFIGACALLLLVTKKNRG